MQYYAYLGDYGPYLPEHEEVMTAEQALEDITAAVMDMDLTLEDIANLFEDTDRGVPARINLQAIKTSADYHGLDIPIPVKLPGVWSAGWNEPGYLPNPDNVALFLLEEEAREYIANEREYWGDDGNLVFWVEYVKSA